MAGLLLADSWLLYIPVTDTDTLATLPCAAGQVAKSDGAGGWSCQDDTDIDALMALIDDLQAQIDAHHPRLVFVSSERFQGDLQELGQTMGALGGDAHCQRLANAASHRGPFMAWMSDSQTSPSARFTQSLVPYKLIDGTVTAFDYFDLTDGAIEAPIDLDKIGRFKGESPLRRGFSFAPYGFLSAAFLDIQNC